ncbi:metal-dependent hydrolase [Flavisericum labens]|uniref:metal-dependent hydrolase n=1 Tax=Flavisericum labens TaxID=3377112 RepID=UPI00387A9CF1
MDSLTQIVLGAACGEAVLGKRIGNKALLFGAIGGTIPDLDVYVGNLLYGNEIDVMLFHRGFMHSILFAVLAAFILGWGIFKLYDSGKRFGATTKWDWISLFFWSLFTHLILDCFTPYGTQLFSPFSNYRVALNNIAVADSAYTLPFLICMIVLMFFNRTSIKRRLCLKLGLGISTAYLLFTIGNKLYVDLIFRKSIKEQGIEIYRFSTQPTIFNNVLWYAIAETKDAYFVADYSLMDRKNQFSNFRKIPKHHDLLQEEYNDIKNLAWFSNQYFSVHKINESEYRYNDLRYPLLDSTDSNSSVFSMLLFVEDSRLDMEPFEPKFENIETVLSALWERVKGV